MFRVLVINNFDILLPSEGQNHKKVQKGPLFALDLNSFILKVPNVRIALVKPKKLIKILINFSKYEVI